MRRAHATAIPGLPAKSTINALQPVQEKDDRRNRGEEYLESGHLTLLLLRLVLKNCARYFCALPYVVRGPAARMSEETSLANCLKFSVNIPASLRACVS